MSQSTPEVDLDDRPVPAPLAPTGDARVDEVLAPLAGLGATPVRTHVAVFEEIHDGLRGVLDQTTAG